MTEWSCREGLEFPPPPDELGGPVFPSPRPSPTRRAGSGAFRLPRCGRGLRGSWGMWGPPWPPLCGGCRCGCPGPPATWAGPTASEAQRGPRLGLGPITPKEREVGCQVAAREAAAGGPGNLSFRCQPEVFLYRNSDSKQTHKKASRAEGRRLMSRSPIILQAWLGASGRARSLKPRGLMPPRS